MTSVTIPACITFIGESAFQNRDALTDACYAGSETQWNSIPIGSDSGNLSNATVPFSVT